MRDAAGIRVKPFAVSAAIASGHSSHSRRGGPSPGRFGVMIGAAYIPKQV
ncbi:MAG TPA: hypothetical protein VIJ66_03995 [Solirubrobacteraceae bacterium]